MRSSPIAPPYPDPPLAHTLAASTYPLELMQLQQWLSTRWAKRSHVRMIGGFALVAAPATYGVTGLKTFIVSHDGVVYEKDFGPATSSAFTRMDRFNPDRTWKPVAAE